GEDVAESSYCSRNPLATRAHGTRAETTGMAGWGAARETADGSGAVSRAAVTGAGGPGPAGRDRPAGGGRSGRGSGEFDQEVAALHLLDAVDGQPAHRAVLGGGDRGLHLHRLDGRDRGTRGHLVALGDREGDH